MATRKSQPSQAFVGLDIGNSTVSCVIGVKEETMPVPSIIGVGVAPNAGMRKGQVVDIEDTVSAITTAIDEAERISGYAIDSATVGVGV
jgi:cell division protein FtsA